MADLLAISLQLSSERDTANIATLVLAVATLAVAILVYLLRRLEPWGRVVFELIDIIESEEMRSTRHDIVYVYPDEYDANWKTAAATADQIKERLDHYGVVLDALSVLYFSRQLNRKLLFQMYGDVLIRSLFCLATYANEQRKLRGKQFWLPFQLLAADILSVWKSEVRKGRYPDSIGLPPRDMMLTFQIVSENQAVRAFLSANGQRTP